ncbi:MAG: thioredoxin family protein [Candidatus Kaiserbacteria bacterium]|nr:thioredoxin family protein [Candidatus Kaiserbacteria bacterium]
MKKVIAIVFLGVIIVGGISYAIGVGVPERNIAPDVSEAPLDNVDVIDPPDSDLEMFSDTSVQQDVAPPSGTATTSVLDTSLSLAQGEYAEYRDSFAQQQLAKGKRVVLFFYADWCPTCRLADKNIREASHTIPSDVVVLKVDYDREKGLKSAYGVSYQHTFVQIAEGGSPITKFQGSSTLPAILANIQ